MSQPPAAADPDRRGLFSLFPPAEVIAHSELVAPEEVPEPYDRLLCHEHHMTVTVENYHGEPVARPGNAASWNAIQRELRSIADKSARSTATASFSSSI